MQTSTWIKRFYSKVTLFFNVPRIVRNTLSNCDGESLGLTNQLENLSEREVEVTLKYIATYFPHLKSLSFRDNHLIKLPQAIGKLTQLKMLYLSHNQLITLPESIGNLTQLTILELINNHLTMLSESIGNLTQLTTLNLNHNRLTTLPETIGKLTQLTILYLSRNQLITVPESIGNLTRLTELYLSNNQLTTLPESIGNLTRLIILDLSNNKLSTLPKSIGNLPHLTTLGLGNNKLTTLPESIGNLARLSRLSLLKNPLIFLPIHFFSLPTDLTLYIENDQLTLLPQKSEYISPDYSFIELIRYFNHIVQLPEMQSVKTLLSFTSVSKQFYHLITGKNVTSLKKTLPQKTLENTIEPAPLPSEQSSQDNVVQTQSFFSMLPSDISKIILLQASGLPSRHYGAFTKLIREKPTTKSIECFLDNTTSPSSQRNWRNVVQQNYEAAQKRSRT